MKFSNMGIQAETFHSSCSDSSSWSLQLQVLILGAAVHKLKLKPASNTDYFKKYSYKSK